MIEILNKIYEDNKYLNLKTYEVLANESHIYGQEVIDWFRSKREKHMVYI
jgi:murein L,D-transpeptidase YcbB/YkuD